MSGEDYQQGKMEQELRIGFSGKTNKSEEFCTSTHLTTVWREIKGNTRMKCLSMVLDHHVQPEQL